MTWASGRGLTAALDSTSEPDPWAQFPYHFNQWQIEEDASGHRKDPLLHLWLGGDKQSNVEAHEGRESAEEVHQHGCLHREPWAEQDCKVPCKSQRQRRQHQRSKQSFFVHVCVFSLLWARPQVGPGDLSPISCGISWHRMATVVAMPVSAEEEKAAPTTRPSAKLWRLSPTITITASRGTPCSGTQRDACVVRAIWQTGSCRATN